MSLRTLCVGMAYVHGAIGNEVRVFFEASLFVESPAQALLDLLSTTWRISVEHIEVYNVHTERECMAEWALGEASTGDARLLESGAGPEGISYTRRDQVLMLVRPATMRRLVAAQEAAEALQAKRCRLTRRRPGQAAHELTRAAA